MLGSSSDQDDGRDTVATGGHAPIPRVQAQYPWPQAKTFPHRQRGTPPLTPKAQWGHPRSAAAVGG